jgi:hypothetical protein
MTGTRSYGNPSSFRQALTDKLRSLATTSRYAAEARRSLLRSARTLDEALAEVGRFINPLLDGSAVGTWHLHDKTWAE